MNYQQAICKKQFAKYCPETHTSLSAGCLPRHVVYRECTARHGFAPPPRPTRFGDWCKIYQLLTVLAPEMPYYGLNYVNWIFA